MKTEYVPSFVRFFLATVLGSVAGGLFIVPFSPWVLGSSAVRWWGHFAMTVLVSPVVFVAISLFGWPLFIAFRYSLAVTRTHAVCAAAFVGALVGAALGTHLAWSGIACLAAVGAFSTWVCWWFTFRPNKAFKPTLPKSRQRGLT